MRLFPSISFSRFQCRGRVHDMVQPAVPTWRNQRSLGKRPVDHPAAIEAKRGINLAAPRAVIEVAKLVLPDELAKPPRPQLSAVGLAIPPREELCAVFRELPREMDAARRVTRSPRLKPR